MFSNSWCSFGGGANGKGIFVSLFLESVPKCIFTQFLKELPMKYLNFTIKENMRGERAKNETFRNAFPRTLVIVWSLVILS